MRRLVVVEACACPFPGVLRARWDGTSFSVRLGPVHRGGRASVVDEHLVVDADVCRDASLLGCGDVLQGSRAYSAAAGLRRLARLLAAHPGCGLAAVPLAGGVGGWALASGFDRSVVLVPDDPMHRGRSLPAGAAEERSLLPSCVHAWLVAGRALRDWPHARVAVPA